MKKENLNRREFLRTGAAAAVTVGLAGAGFGWFPAATAIAETDLFAQINRARDPNNLQGLELGHVPRIMAPDSVARGAPFEVEIRVGEKLHEMIPAHYIDWIDLYAGDIFLTKFVITPNFNQPICKVAVTLNASATLRAIEHCNLHGLWEGNREIKVV
jgi:superoxide reductase